MTKMDTILLLHKTAVLKNAIRLLDGSTQTLQLIPVLNVQLPIPIAQIV